MDCWQDSAFSDEVQYWVLPDSLEPYRDLIADTGSETIEEVMNDRVSGVHDNYMRAARLMAVNAQIELLCRLRDQGFLLPKPIQEFSTHRA